MKWKIKIKDESTLCVCFVVLYDRSIDKGFDK